MGEIPPTTEETLSILIVEDDDDARESLRDVLSIHDHRVETAASATAAFDLHAQQYEFDVILLDRKLPDGMVEELLPRFRELAPRADLIVVTGYADLNASIAALRHGVTDYIIKPINADALLATLRRIGQRRRIERELREERQFAEMVLQTADAIIVVLDVNGRIQRYNRYLAELSGRPLPEVAHQDWFETFVPAEQRHDVRASFERTIDQQRSIRVVSRILAADGEEREIRWSQTLLRGDNETEAGVLLVGLDVTDLIDAQKKLLQSERLAAIGQTMAGLAHESRNALQRLRNAVELLEDDLEGNEDALLYVDKISRAGNDLRDLLDEVRAYAAPIALDLKPVSIASVWRRAWQSLEHRVQKQAARFCETSEEQDSPTIVGDARRLEQVFRNLLENALDACGQNAEISVTCLDREPEVEIRIQDNGPGMPVKDQERAFDAFYTTKPTGTGLGLAIVYRIIEAHQGTIAVADGGDGTTFVIKLPMKPRLVRDPR